MSRRLRTKKIIIRFGAGALTTGDMVTSEYTNLTSDAKSAQIDPAEAASQLYQMITRYRADCRRLCCELSSKDAAIPAGFLHSLAAGAMHTLSIPPPIPQFMRRQLKRFIGFTDLCEGSAILCPAGWFANDNFCTSGDTARRPASGTHRH